MDNNQLINQQTAGFRLFCKIKKNGIGLMASEHFKVP